MAKVLARRLWTELLGRLNTLDRPVELRHLVVVVRTWTGGNLAQFGKLAARYGLDDLVSREPDQQPVEYSDMNADEEIERLRAVPPSSLETLAMRVRDLLWGALVYRTDRQCPRCDSDRLRALRTEVSATVLACDRCGFACDADGRPWRGPAKLSPMTTSEVKAEGLLGNSHR